MANTDMDTDDGKKGKKDRISQKDYIDAAGAVVDIEKATGLRYTSLADKKAGDMQIPGIAAGSVQAMLAVFGLRTVATNFGSQNARKTNPDEKFASDTDCVLDRFSRIVQDDWGTEGGGGGFGIDQDALLEAINKASPFPDDATRDRIKGRIATEADYRSTMRKHSAIAPHYDELLRAKRDTANEKPLADLLA